MIKLQNGTPSELLDRQPPMDDRAEMALLGSVLVDPRCVDEIGFISRGDFYSDVHGEIYAVARKMHDTGKKIDVELIRAELKRAQRLEFIGGGAYLASLIKAAPNAFHVAYYAKVVKEHSVRRQLIETSTEAIRDAWDSTSEVSQIVDRAESRIYAIQDKRDDQQAVTFHDAIRDALGRIERRQSTGVIEGMIKSGFDNIDDKAGGFRDSEVTILAGRTSMGKTALALCLAYRVAKAGHLVTFFSLEMSAEELTDRMLVAASKVNSHKMRSGTMEPDDRSRLIEYASELSSLPIHFDASPYQTMSGIASQVRRVHRKTGEKIGLIVVDYLQLVHPDDDRAPREQQVAKISRRLKLLAKEFGAPVLCLAQLNRQLENRTDPRPKLSDLRESGSIEQDADNVWFIHRPEVHAKSDSERNELSGQAKLLIAKQRNGPRDVVADLVFLKSSMRFEDEAPKRHNVFDQFNNTQDDNPYYSEGF